MDSKVNVLNKKAIWLVKAQWNYYGSKDATWKHKENVRDEYLQNFVNFDKNEY